jgi:hypothetical protein
MAATFGCASLTYCLSGFDRMLRVARAVIPSGARNLLFSKRPGKSRFLVASGAQQKFGHSLQQ